MIVVFLANYFLQLYHQCFIFIFLDLRKLKQITLCYDVGDTKKALATQIPLEIFQLIFLTAVPATKKKINRHHRQERTSSPMPLSLQFSPAILFAFH